jgi:hypothetical protein
MWQDQMIQEGKLPTPEETDHDPQRSAKGRK